MNSKKNKLIMLIINIVLLILGIWQIYRGIDKKKLINLQSQYQFINIGYALSAPLEQILYKTTSVSGKFIQPTFFLYRNQAGQNGYWAVNPLNYNNQFILIAHSFLKTPANHPFLSLEQLNNIYKTDTKTIQNIYNLQIVKYIPRVFNLTKDKFSNQDSLIVQNITPNQYQQNYTHHTANFILINKSLISNIETITPDRHFAYAITWFSLWIVSLYFSYLVFKDKKLQL